MNQPLNGIARHYRVNQGTFQNIRQLERVVLVDSCLNLTICIEFFLFMQIFISDFRRNVGCRVAYEIKELLRV